MRRLLAVLLLIFAGLSAQAQQRPRVLVDLSHEFTFRYDGLGGSAYWSGDHAIDNTSSFASLTRSILDVHDVLVISQTSANVPFLAGEFQMIKDWVAEGGGLFLAGNRDGYFRAANPFPRCER